MKVLLIYNEVPECLTVYSLDVTTEEYDILSNNNGKYINASTGPDGEIDDLYKEDDLMDFIGKLPDEAKIYEEVDGLPLQAVKQIESCPLIVIGFLC